MADIPQYKPDYRLWVDNIDDLKLLVDETNNFKDSRLTPGTILYVQEEDRYYSIKGQGHTIIGYEPLKVSSGNIFFGPDEPELKEDEKAETIWVVDDEEGSREGYINGYQPEENIISSMNKRISDLEKMVNSLSAILEYGIIGGDSSIGARTVMMGKSPICTNPNTDEDEETYEDGMLKPAEILATVPNLAIKHDTVENFKKNYQNLINGELIWVRNGENINAGDPGLCIYAANKLYVGFIPLASSGGGGGGNINPDDMTTISINSEGILDILSNKIKVDADGILNINDNNNFTIGENNVLHISSKQSSPVFPNNQPSQEETISATIEDNILVLNTNNLMTLDENNYLVFNKEIIDDENNIKL